MIAHLRSLPRLMGSVIAVLSIALAAVSEDPQAPRVLLSTDMGDIVVEVYPDRAPHTAGSFLRYVDEGLYEGAGFYRVVRPDNDRSEHSITVVQGGVLTASGPPAGIPHESTKDTGLRHVDGAVSIARLEPGTGSAAAFFISIGAQPALDHGGLRNPDGQGFAVFGRVIDGMDVVKAINALDADAPIPVEAMQGQILNAPVEFTAKRIGSES